ncbi:unnamed protein product [Oikopleura dioica]|uniref:Uncharacterized protein n=1 Tax=Oikopleura dioica TaxID=34765 RepID=E4XT23_OIKDI|nr:unnamed protein product [Oikopleura dioica]
MVDDRDRLFTTLSDDNEPGSSRENSENDRLLRSRNIVTSVSDQSTSDEFGHSSHNTSADNVRFDVAKLVWDGSWHVVKHSDLPLWLQDNDYLINWHRPSVRSFGYCFSSIFRWHTETGNIWTHLIGGLIFIGLTSYYMFLPTVRFVAPLEEKLVFALFFISAMLCLFFSTLFHTLSCHSERILHIFGKLDYSGIALLTMGSFVPWVYYTFYCETQSKIVYMVTISTLAVISVILSQWDRFARPEYRAIRAGVFLSLGLSGVIPMIHALIKNGAKFSFGEGATFYATRFPECVWPGRFDLVFQSHQIFHVAVVVAALIHMYGISNLQYYRWEQGNTCTPDPNDSDVL